MKAEGEIKRDSFAEKVTEGFKAWAGNHFDSDFPVLVTDKHVLTPRQIADEIEKRTLFGQGIIESYRHIVDRNPRVRNIINGLQIARMYEAGAILYQPEILTVEQRNEIRDEARKKLSEIRLREGLVESTRY